MSRSSGRGLLDEAPSRVFRRRRGHIGFLADRRPARRWRRGGSPAAGFDQIRDRGDCRGWRRIGRTGQRERRCGGLLRRAQGWVALTATTIGPPIANAAVTSEVAAVIGSTPIIDFSHLLNSYQLRTLLHSFPRSLAAKAKKAPARGGLHCRDHGEPTYGWAVRSLVTSASNVASLTSYAA